MSYKALALPLKLAFLVNAAVTGPAMSEAAEVPDTVPGCEEPGARLSSKDLMDIVPGHKHTGMGSEGHVVQRFSALDDASASGFVDAVHPGSEEFRARYSIGDDGICMTRDNQASSLCQQIATCPSNAVGHVGWWEGGAWTIFAIKEFTSASDAMAADPPAITVDDRPVYDTASIAPAADPEIADGDNFSGAPGLIGHYIGEADDSGQPVIENFLTAQNYSTGRRINDGRRLVSSLIRLHQPGKDPVLVYHRAGELDVRDALLGFLAKPEGYLDLTSASPGVIDIVTDEAGNASADHWSNLRTHVFTTYARWDEGTHDRPAQIRVISMPGPFSGRSILVCERVQHERVEDHVDVLDGDQTCRRYDRALDVAEVVGDRNGLQIVAALREQEAQMVMQVADISVSDDVIMLRARDLPSVQLLNTGQFQGWGDWMDRTEGTSRRRPVTCRFPMEAADRLASVETGTLLRIDASLDSASKDAVDLDCNLTPSQP